MSTCSQWHWGRWGWIMEQIAAVITIKLYLDPLYSPTSNTQPSWDTLIYTQHTHIIYPPHTLKNRQKSYCVWRTSKIREKFRWKSVLFFYFFPESPRAEWLQATERQTHTFTSHTHFSKECVCDVLSLSRTHLLGWSSSDLPHRY